MEESQGVSEFLAESAFRAANLRRTLAAPKMDLRSGLFEILRAARDAISLRLLSIQLVAFAPGYLLYIIGLLTFFRAPHRAAGTLTLARGFGSHPGAVAVVLGGPGAGLSAGGYLAVWR